MEVLETSPGQNRHILQDFNKLPPLLRDIKNVLMEEIPQQKERGRKKSKTEIQFKAEKLWENEIFPPKTSLYGMLLVRIVEP